MAPRVQNLRGLRSALVTLAQAAGLRVGELYQLTEADAGEVAIGLAAGRYEQVGALRRMESNDFHNTGTSLFPFTGAAISTGTNTTAPATRSPLHPGTVLLRSSTTANSGYRYTSGIDMRGGAGLRAHTIMRAAASISGTTTIRAGLHDSTTNTAPVDGAFFEAVGTTLRGKCRNNNTESQTTATVTMTAGGWYRCDVLYVTDSSVRFVITDDTAAVLLDETVTTNVPNTFARSFRCSFVATNSGTTAADLCELDYAAVGR